MSADTARLIAQARRHGGDLLHHALAEALEAAEAQRDTLARAVNALDLSDNWTFDNAEPGELISCTRPVEVWREVRAALAGVAPREEPS